MAFDPGFFERATGYQWDEGNSEKSLEVHGVSRSEAEEVFTNHPLLISDDLQHSQDETRFVALGRTDLGRELAVVFTLRGTLLRVISARPMSRRERTRYAQAF